MVEVSQSLMNRDFQFNYREVTRMETIERRLEKIGLLELRGILSRISAQINGNAGEMERQLDMCHVYGQNKEIVKLVRRIKEVFESYQKEFEGFYFQISEEIEKRIKED